MHMTTMHMTTMHRMTSRECRPPRVGTVPGDVEHAVNLGTSV